MKNFKMIEFIKDSVVYKGIIMNPQEHSQDYVGSFLKIIQDKFQERRCPRESVKNN
jgi:hypothetical protein